MADLLLHFAVGVFVASRFHFDRLPRYLIALAAVLPDLDALLARLILWRGAEWFGWTPQEAHTALTLFGHGGVLHSSLTILLVGLLAGGITRRWQVGAAVGVAWLSHTLLDVFSPQGALLWWPFSTQLVLNPLIVDLSPLFVILSLFYLVGTLMGDLYLFDVHKDFGERTRLILRKFGPRLAKGAAQMGGFVLLFLLVAKNILLIGDGLAGADVMAAGFPDYNIYEETDDGYRIVRWGAFGDAESAETVRHIPAGLSVADRETAENGLCIAERLPGAARVHHPVVLDMAPRLVIGEGAAATPLRGPAEEDVLVFVPHGDRPGFQDAWTAGFERPEHARAVLPPVVLAGTGC